MNSVSICGILTRKNLVKHPLRLLLSLSFASWCLTYKTPAAVSQQIWTPFSTVPLLNFGNFAIESFTMFIGEGSRVFRKKYPFGDTENEISVTCYAPQTV